MCSLKNKDRRRRQIGPIYGPHSPLSSSLSSLCVLLHVALWKCNWLRWMCWKGKLLRAQQGHVDGIWKTIHARRKERKTERWKQNERGEMILETNTWLNLPPGWILDGHCDYGKEDILDATLQTTIQNDMCVSRCHIWHNWHLYSLRSWDRLWHPWLYIGQADKFDECHISFLLIILIK